MKELIYVFGAIMLTFAATTSYAWFVSTLHA